VLAVLLRSAPIARLISRLRRNQSAAYTPEMIVVAIESRFDGEESQRVLEHLVANASWMGKIIDPGEEWEVTSSDGEVRRERRAPPDERGFTPMEFRAVAVQAGTEQLAVAVIRRRSRLELLESRIVVARWPRFQLAGPALSGRLTGTTHDLLARRAVGAGTQPHRIAVIDTPFDAPPAVNVIRSTAPGAQQLRGTYPHGAVVCSLIAGSSPSATIDLYPVLRGDDMGVDGQNVFGALRVIAERAANGDDVDVVNLSLTTPEGAFPEQTEWMLRLLFDGIDHASQGGTAFVAATGNHGGTMGLPARLADVLGVGCTDTAGALWPDSAHGPKPASEIGSYGWLVAAGVGLVDQEAGTSYAAASVSGLLARAVGTGTPAREALLDLQEGAFRTFDGYAPDSHGAGRAQEP
jgi:hypothetical protein